MRWKISFLPSWLALAWLLVGCDFDKEITVDLPDQEPQLFVECYLESGKPPRLLLTETQSYFDSINATPVFFATVTISGPSGTYSLQPGLYQDTAARKIYNWQAEGTLQLEPGQAYTLQITSGNKRASAVCMVMPPPHIDSVTYKVAEADTAAYTVTWFHDLNPGQANFYRLVVNDDDTASADDGAATNYAFQDNFRDGTLIPARSGYTVSVGDSLTVRLFHLDNAYYQFLLSQRLAQNANGNPFANPAKLRSNITGGRGIFTALSFDKVSLRIK